MTSALFKRNQARLDGGYTVYRDGRPHRVVRRKPRPKQSRKRAEWVGEVSFLDVVGELAFLVLLLVTITVLLTLEWR